MKDKQPEKNEFDEIQDSINPDSQEVDEIAKAKAEREKNLIYHIFAKTEEGQELLSIWIENQIVLSPVYEYGSSQTPTDIGFMQGVQHFIRSIFTTIKNFKEDK